MTVFYLDPENGNDANDGLSFANRWKTIGLGATAARTAPGDTIRIIASPDPTTPGNATWTDNSGTITWAAAKNKVIEDCEVAWTGATNITATTSASRKQGSVSAQFTPATAFTTGKVAHRTLPAALDLSTFQQVSFWFRHGALMTAGQMELRLCSDTTGDVAVHTIPIPAGSNGFWRTVVFDNSAALGSSIQSLSLWANADPSITAFRIDNIVACAAASSADCVTHEHAIGKNTVGEPEWYSILSIGDSTVVLGGYSEVDFNSLLPRPYRGTSETVATYLLLGMKIGAFTTAQRTMNEAGAVDNPITYSGGWNRTDMSTLTGVSYLNGQHAATSAIIMSGRSFNVILGIGLLYFSGEAISEGSSITGTVQLADVVGCKWVFGLGSASDGAWDVSFQSAHGTGQTGFSLSTATSARMRFKGRRLHGSVTSTTSAAVDVFDSAEYEISSIDNCGGFAISLVNLSSRGTEAVIRNTTMNNNAGAGDVGIATGTRGTLQLYDSVFTIAGLTGIASCVQIKSTRDQGVSTAHKVTTRYWTVASATDQRHTASGVSWKFNPLNTTYASTLFPAFINLAKIACAAGALVTVKVWAYRDNTGLSVGMRILGGQIAGVPDTISVVSTGAANTWEELTLTFTPTVAGVIEVLGIAYGGTTFSGWLDDMTVTQA